MNIQEKSERWIKLAPWIAAGISAIVYFFTLAPSLDKIDAGELATVQLTGGIAHPTGYPLFTILGWLFTRLPLGMTPIYQVNFLAMLYVTFAVFFFAKAVFIILGSLKVRKIVPDKNAKSKKQKTYIESIWLTPSQILIAGLFATFCMAFSKTLWEQATSTEVYSLQALLLCIILFTCARAFAKPEKKSAWIWVAVAFGFGMTNHLTAGLLVPAIGFLFFSCRGVNSKSFQFAGILCGIAFGIWVLVYLWLPIRASMDPSLNWGDPSDWQGFWFHVFAKQFKDQFMLSAFFGDNYLNAKEIVGKNLQEFIINIPFEFVFAAIVPALIGMIRSFKINSRFAWFFILIFFFTLFFVIFYQIKDLAPYFMADLLVIGIWISIGIASLLSWMKNRAALSKIIVAACLISITIEAGVNLNKNDKSELFFYEDYARSFFESLPKDAIVVSGQFDWIVSEGYYLQTIENLRPDVAILDYEMLRNRKWFSTHLKKNHPDVFQALQPELNLFNKQLIPFHYYGMDSVTPALGATFQNFWFKLMNDKEMKRPVCIGPEILFEKYNQKKEIGFPSDLTLVPEHYVYRVIHTDELKNYLPLSPEPAPIRYSEKEAIYYTMNVKQMIHTFCMDRAKYELKFGNKEKAKALIQKAKATLPGVPIPAEFREL